MTRFTRRIALTAVAAAAFASLPALAADKGQPRRFDPRRHPQLHGRHQLLGQPGEEGSREGTQGPEDHDQDRRQRARAGQPAAGPVDGHQDQRAGRVPVRIGRADQAGRAGQGQGRLRHRGRPRPDRHQRAGRLRGRRQHRLRPHPAEYIVKQLGGKGNVVALRGIATTLDNERMDAFNAVLKNSPT